MSDHVVLLVDNTAVMPSLAAPIAHLMAHRRFVLYDSTPHPETGDVNKKPWVASLSYGADYTDPATWSTWEEIRATRARFPQFLPGYVFTEDDEHIFIDIDGGLDKNTGIPDPWAQRIIDAAQSYTEVTPSRRGIRIIGLAGPALAPGHYITPGAALGASETDPGHVGPKVKSTQAEVLFHTPLWVTMSDRRLKGTEHYGLRRLDDLAFSLAKMGRKIGSVEGHVPNESLIARHLPDVEYFLSCISNPVPGMPDDWETWKHVGMATAAAVDGDSIGFEWFSAWSRRHPQGKHQDHHTLERWEHWTEVSPANRVGAGTLFELAKKACAASGYDFRPPSWGAPEAFKASPLTIEQTTVKSAAEVAREAVAKSSGADPSLPIPAYAQRALMSPLSPRELRARLGDKVTYLIKGVLTKGDTVLLSGLPGSAKSPIAHDMSVRIAMGVDWCGRQCEAARVIYVAAESAWQTSMNYGNFAAGVLEQSQGMAPGTVNEADALEFIEDSIQTFVNPLTLEKDTALLIASIEALFGPGGRWEGEEPGLVTLDTLRAVSSGGVNKDEDMAVVQQALLAIKVRWPRVVVLVVHHAAKSAPGAASGTNRLDGLAETQLNMTMLPRGKGLEDPSMMPKAEAWGPGPEFPDWRYINFRFTCNRMKMSVMPPDILVTMMAQDSDEARIRMTYDYADPIIGGAAKAAISGTPFKDERSAAKIKTVLKPVAIHEGDNGAFASSGTPVEVAPPAKAHNGGAGAVRVLVVGWLKIVGGRSASEIAAWLRDYKIEDEDTRVAAGLHLDAKTQEIRVRDRLKELVEAKLVEKRGERPTRWYAL